MPEQKNTASKTLLHSEPGGEFTNKQQRILDDKFRDKFSNATQFEYFCQLPIPFELREKFLEDVSKKNMESKTKHDETI